MKLTFPNILGCIVLILALLYVSRLLFRLKLEGFRDGITLTTISENSPPPSDDITKWCPKNSVLFYILTFNGNTSTDKYICYPAGITNVDPIFLQKLAKTIVKLFYPKGITVSLFSKENATGTPDKIFKDGDSDLPGFNYQFFEADKVPFSSVKIVDPAAPEPAAAAPAATSAAAASAETVTRGNPKLLGSAGLTVTCPSGGIPILQNN